MAQTTEDRIAEIAQNFGQGFNNYQAGQERQRNQALQAEALRRQQAIQAMEIEAKMSEATGQNFIGSDYGNQILKGMKPDISTMSLGLTRKTERENAALARQAKLDESSLAKNNSIINKNNKTFIPVLSYEQKLDLKAKKDAEAKAIERNDPAIKLEKLGAEGRSKVGALASGLQAIDQMTKASSEGHGPQYLDSNTSIVGGLISDTPYSEAERTVGEVIGRLQSGGAIGTQEIKTFKSLGPRPGDDPATRARKLSQQKDFLQNKLTAYSINNKDLEQLGFKTTSDYGNKSKPAPISQQHVNTVKAMSDEELMQFLKGG